MKRLSLVVLLVSGLATWFVLNGLSQPETTTTSTQTLSEIDIRIEKMSLEDKIASLLILSTPDNNPESIAQFTTEHKLGGTILMSNNIPSDPSLLLAATKAIRDSDADFPPYTAIDQEGETVTRLPNDNFLGASSLKNLPAAKTGTAFAGRSELLKKYGINLNFGIVADVTGDQRSFIYERALGTTPEESSARVDAAVRASQGKTLTTIKHFPGHGAPAGDSHTSIPATKKSFDDWMNYDAKPFVAGINAKVDVVMFGHLLYEAVDDKPASLSKSWHDILENDLKFKGVTITDDLSMLQNSGNPAFNDPVQNAVDALKAGNTLLLFVSDQPNSPKISENPAALISSIKLRAEQDSELQNIINANVKKSLELRAKISKL